MKLMSIRKKLASMLLGQQPGETPDMESEEIYPEAKSAETADIPDSSDSDVFDASREATLELPQEHPLHRLYNQCRQQTGYLPTPHICMDEEGAVPQAVIKKEKDRLKSALTSVCNARLKEATGVKHSAKEDLGTADAPPVLDALPFFFLSSDKLFAWVMVFPPMGGGKELTRDMLSISLMEHDISYGVDSRLVNRLDHDKRRYFSLYLIAKGKPAFDGKNGNIVDNFPRVVERVLKADEHDQVDYMALNLIHNVEKGQEICRLIKPTDGEPGRTVLDEEISAKGGKAVPLPKGRNTEISEDQTQLLASISGAVEFTGRFFQVKPVLNIEGDVDYSTGNLNFWGDVNINGSILSGFTVRATGSIHIGGVVEAGSIVEAGGDLVVAKGILGDGTTFVQSHRSIFAKFVENSTVSVRENLQADCIIGCTVYCGGEVTVQSGRGTIMSGRIWAAHRVRASVVGSKAECKTTIDLGGDPCKSFEREITQKEVNTLEMELEHLECQPDSPAKASLLRKTKIKLTTANIKLQQLEEFAQKEDEKKDEEDDERDIGRLECGLAYPGTKVRFGNIVYRLRQTSRHCIFTLVNDQIIMM